MQGEPLYALALLRRYETFPPALGLQGGTVIYVAVGQVAAAVQIGLDVEALKAAPREVLLQAVLDHDRAIGELFARFPLLPLRFGTAFVSQEALEQYLRDRGDDILARLDALGDRQEYLLQGVATPPAVPQPPALSGREYLLAKRDRFQQVSQWQAQIGREREGCIAQLNAAIATPIYEAETAESQASARLCLLLDATELAAVRDLLRAWEQEFPHWEWTVSAPQPPYHFAALERGNV